MRTCPCALSCEDNKYLSSLSASVWPSNKYWQLLASDLQYPYSMVWQGDSSGHSSGDAREAVRKEIQDDFTSVKFNFDSLNVQTITQSPKYSVSKFEAFQCVTRSQLEGMVSALGGALGLYLGCTLLMLFELFELVIDLVLRVLTVSKKK